MTSSESLESSYPAWFRWLRMWRLLHGVALLVLLLTTVVYVRLSIPVRSATFLVGESLALLLWMVPFGQLALLECPRCHQRFFFSGVRFIGIILFFFQSHCAHCRLPEYAADTSTKE
jgi:hypothetical protein